MCRGTCGSPGKDGDWHGIWDWRDTMKMADQVWVAGTARALFDRLKRPASAREFANVWGCEKAEAERWLRMGVEAKVLVHFDRWVVRGYLLQGAWGPIEMRAWLAERKRAKVLEWVAANGPVRTTYQALADNVGLGAGDCHSVCKSLMRSGRLRVDDGWFEVVEAGSEAGGSRYRSA